MVPLVCKPASRITFSRAMLKRRGIVVYIIIKDDLILNSYLFIIHYHYLSHPSVQIFEVNIKAKAIPLHAMKALGG
jgi:hypothetical protein